MEVRVENVSITALVWPTDNGGIIIWQTPRIHLDGLAYSEQEIGVFSRNRIGSLITSGIRANSDKLSCHHEA